MCSFTAFMIVAIVKMVQSISFLGAGLSVAADMGWLTDNFVKRLFLRVVDPTLLNHLQALHWLFLFLTGTYGFVVIFGAVAIFGACCSKHAKLVQPFFIAWFVELTLTIIVGCIMMADSGKYGAAAEAIVVQYFSKVDYYKTMGLMHEISDSKLLNAGLVKVVMCGIELLLFYIAYGYYRQLVANEQTRARLSGAGHDENYRPSAPGNKRAAATYAMALEEGYLQLQG